MIIVGARELKERTGEILRRVREHGEEILITYHGRVIARLSPPYPLQPASADLSAIWSDLDRLAMEIGAHWPVGVTAVEAVDEERREA